MLKNRYDFSILFDVKNGNPNGNPDADNMPRQDLVTGKGLVTDVCLKHKIRQYIELVHGTEEGRQIFLRNQAISDREITQTLIRHQILQEGGVLSDASIKKSRSRLEKNTSELDAMLLELLCANYFDIRAFGAVLTALAKSKTLTAQVQGPVQLTIAESIDPILPQNLSITRTGAASEEYFQKAGYGTIGNKWIVPYGLYRCNGYISAAQANKYAGPTGTGALTEADLELLWEAIANMFEQDHSAARGEMNVRGLYIWKHASLYGNAHAHRIFDTLKVEKKAGVVEPTAFTDYQVIVDETALPESVTLRTYDI